MVDTGLICQRWHKAVCQASGNLVVAIVKRRLSREELRATARLLAKVVEEMERLADGNDVSDIVGFIDPRSV